MTEPSAFVDVSFPITGASVPRDHGYLLFDAVAARVPALNREPEWGLLPIHGREDGQRIQLNPGSRVTLRLPPRELGQALALTGCELALGVDKVRLGMAKIQPLAPARHLRGLVVWSGGPVIEVALRQDLAALPLEQEPWEIGLRVGERRVLRTRERSVMAYEVDLYGLQPHASIVVQARGIGTRRHMGAGVFEAA